MGAGIIYNVAPPVEREVCDESTIYRLNDGGMDLDKSNLPSKGWLPELCPVFRDKVERKAYACLRVMVVEAAEANATTIKIKKNPFLSFLKAGFLLSDGTNVIPVASVDTSNEAYDEVTVNIPEVEAVAAVPAVEAGYYDAESTDEGALKVVASDATEGQINLASVTPYHGTKTLAADDYVVLKEAQAAVAAVEAHAGGLYDALAAGQVLFEAKAADNADPKNVANFASFGWRDIEKEDSVTFVGRVFGILEDELYIPFTEADKAALGDRFMFI